MHICVIGVKLQKGAEGGARIRILALCIILTVYIVLVSASRQPLSLAKELCWNCCSYQSSFLGVRDCHFEVTAAEMSALAVNAREYTRPTQSYGMATQEG